MRPYYEDSSVKIYHGDSREILPQIGEVDLVVTDPPYGIFYKSRHGVEQGFNNQGKTIVGDHEFPQWVFEIKYRIAMFCFGRWDNLVAWPKPKSVIAWIKNHHTCGDTNHEFGRSWELAAFYPGPEHSFLYRPRDSIEIKRVHNTMMVHINQKPVGVIRHLIEPHPGEIILDPFMGSGTTLVAAKDLGRKAIGIEIEEKYCEIAAKRCSQEILPLTTERTA